MEFVGKTHLRLVRKINTHTQSHNYKFVIKYFYFSIKEAFERFFETKKIGKQCTEQSLMRLHNAFLVHVLHIFSSRLLLFYTQTQYTH